MVLVDTSVWVDYLRGSVAPLVRRTVDRLINDHRVAVTPVIRLELFRGATSEEAQALKDAFEGIHELPFESPHWQRAYRLVLDLRAMGFTPSIPDLLIATSALEHRLPLYHRDAAFDAMARHIGLHIYRPTP